MATDTLTYEGTLTQLKCWCSIRFAVPSELADKALYHEQRIYCPLGHGCNWSESEEKRLRRELEFANRKADNARECAAAVRRQLSAAKGQQTKLKKRIAAGVCPVPDCRRHFQNLAAHIKSKHPDFPSADE